MPAFKRRGNAANFFTDSNVLSFLFSLLDKNAASSSSAAVDAVAAAKGKQPVVEASQIPRAKAQRERFKADRCQCPLGRPGYGRCLLVEYVVSLFADVSGDATTIPTGYACKEDFST